MVAIVSGNSLGLSLTSAATLGQGGVAGQAANGRSGERVYVNVSNGNLVLQSQDDRLATQGAFSGQSVRTYNSQGALNDDNADNWAEGFYQQQVSLVGTLNAAGSSVLRVDSDGASASYTYDASLGLYVCTQGSGAYDTIAYDGGNQQWVWTDGDSRSVQCYDQTGRLQSATDAAGNTLTYHYGSNGLIASVADSSGETTCYDYNGTQLTQIRDVLQGGGTVTRVHYQYDASGRLSQVTVDLSPDDNSTVDGNVYTTTYGYDGTSTRVSSITQSDGTSLSIGYVQVGGTYCVQTVTDALGNKTAFDYDPASGRTLVTDALGQTSTYDYDASGQLLSIAQPAAGGAASVTTFSYDANGDVISATDATGHATTMSYDERGNQVLLRDADGNTVARTFDANNRVISESVSSSGALVARNGVTITGNSVVKSSGTDGAWDASVNSATGYVGGAAVHFRPQQSNKSFGVGLNSDPMMDNSLASLDYSIYCRNDGTLWAFESNHSVQSLGTYAAGDDMSVAYDGNQVTYTHNGTVVRTVTVAIDAPLYLDSSFQDLGARASDISFGPLTGASAYAGGDIASRYALDSGLTLSGSTVSKTGGVDGQWDSALRSNEGYLNGAYVSFTASQNDKAVVVGLDDVPGSHATAASITWGLLADADGTLSAMENGTKTVLGTYNAGDALSVTYDGKYIRYLQNGTVLRAYGYSGNLPWYADAAFCNSGAAISNLRFGSNNPADQVTRYVYDAADKGQLRFVISGQGAVTEYRYDSYGQRVATIRYPKAPYSNSPLVPDQVPTETQMAAWAAAQDQSASVRLDMAYDFRGQLKSSTAYASVDAAGNGVLDGRQSVTQYVYDQAGLLLSTASGTGGTSYTYDGLGRVLTAQDGLHNTTVTRYDDAQGKITVTTASGLITTSSFDSAGRLVSVQQSSAAVADLAQTSYWYDADGHLRMSQDATGVKSYWLYDEAGRQVAAIAADGSLVESVYNADNQVIRSIRYAGAVDVASLVDASGNPANISLAAVRPSGASYSSWNLYDSVGRLTQHVDELGYVTETRYDAASRVSAVVRYANPVDTSAINTATQAFDAAVQPVASSDDRISRNFYDEDNHLVASLDADGYLTETTYDAAGQARCARRYATATTASLRSTGTLAQLRPAVDAVNDTLAWTFYDGQGRVIGELDNAGVLTEYGYDANGNRNASTVYANPAQLAPSAVTLSTGLADLRPAASGQDLSTSSTYDADNRLWTQTDAAGTTQYTYDSVGHLVSTTRALGTSVAATSTQRYDVQGRLSGELDATGSAALAALGASPTQAQIDAVWASHGVQYAYDAAGRRTSATDADGNTTLYYYDLDGHLTHTVSALGEVQENQYDYLGQLKATIRYAGTVSTSGLTGGLVTSTFLNAVAAIKNPAQDSRTSYTYDARGQLIQTTDALNASAQSVYDAFGQLVATQDANGNVSRYAYDADGQQIYSVDALGHVTQTEYDAQGRVIGTCQYATAIALPGNSPIGLLGVEQIAAAVVPSAGDRQTQSLYDADGRLSVSVDATGAVTQYQYDNNGHVVARREYANKATVGQSADALQQSLATLASTADTITRYAYDAEGRQIYSVDSFGQVTQTQYDALGNVIGTREYIKPITLPANSGAAVTALSAAQIQGALQPDNVNDRITQSLYDADGRLAVSVDPAGAVTQYQYDGAGHLVAQRHYAKRVSVGQTASALQQSLATLYGPADEVTRYAYDADGRKVYSVDALGYVTYTQYDAKGEATLVRQFANPIGLPASSGSGIATLSITQIGNALTQSGSDRITQSLYDLDGRVSVSVDATGAVTAYQYDVEGHVTLEHEYVNRTSVGQSASALQQSLATLANAGDRITRWAYDALGREACQVNTQGVVTQTQYDAFGRAALVRQYATAIAAPAGVLSLSQIEPLLHASASDRVTQNLYDADGRVTVSVDGTGAVTQYQYDAEGRVVAERQYAKRVTVGQSADALQQAVSTLADAANDRITRYAYDADGRQVYRVDAQGQVTETQYDALGNALTTLQYANAISLPSDSGAAITALSASQIEGVITHNAAQDRVTHNVYDADGQLSYSVNAEGAVTRYTYDAAGNLSSKLQYSRSISLPETSTATVADITSKLAAMPANDRSTHYYYDADNRLRFTVDALGYASETRYYADHTQSIRYAKAPVVANLDTAATADIASAVAAIANSTNDETTTQYVDLDGRTTDHTDAMGVTSRDEYDALGRLTRHTDALSKPEQTVTSYTYDALGRVLSKTIASGTTAAQTTQYSYDAFGRKLTELSPTGWSLIHDNTAWAQAERQREGYPADATTLTAAQVQALQQAYTTAYSYDADNRTLSTVNAQGASTTTAYDAFGDAIKVVDPLGHIGYSYFDKLGRVTLQVDPLGYATQTTYAGDFDNNVLSVRRYFNKVAAGTNENARPTLTQSGNDALTSYTYDRLGRVLTSADAAGTESVTYHDASNNIFNKSVTNKVGGTTSFVYDRDGNELSETLPVQSGTSTVVNSYAYDAFGNRTQSIEAVGLAEQRVTTYRYDKDNRAVYRIGTAYNALNPDTQTLTSVTPVDYTHYDALGRVIETLTNANWTGSAAVGGQRTLTYYDAAGNQVMTVAADGAVVAKSYTASGKVYKTSAYAKTIALPATAGGTPPAVTADAADDRVTTSLYDSLDRLVETDLDNVVWWEQSSDPSAPVVLTLYGSQPATVATQKFTYDAAGNVVEQTDGRGNSSYTYYDALGRKVLAIDADGYATAWDYGDIFDSATQQVQYSTALASGHYALQNAVAGSTGDPAALRKALDALVPPGTNPNRTTQFSFDRAGRTVEQRVKNVASQYVDSTGTVSTFTADAVTDYQYDGLGNVTEQKLLVAAPAGGAQVWDTTDYTYDKLGRLTEERDPGYTDYSGASVRPTTDTEYDGLGNKLRVIQRGTNPDPSVESDDRITVFNYDHNGNLTQQTDADGNVTVFDLDAQGHVARSTVEDVLDADGNTHDVAKLFWYDAMGRQTKTQDGGTGEIRNTAYNAFGEISAEGLGSGAYQEFTQYNVMGKVQKSNTGDGVVKIYLYDLDGNTTRQITSETTDLTNVSVVAAASDTSLNHTFSIYDKRNNLVRTVEPDISYQQDQISTQAAYTQQLTDLYGAISTGNAAGGTYNQASVDATGYGYTQVGSDSGSTKFNSPSVGGNPFSAPVAPTTATAATKITPTPFYLSWSGTQRGAVEYPNKPPGSSIGFAVPATFSKGGLYQIMSNTGVIVATGLTANSSISLPNTGMDRYFLQFQPTGQSGWMDIGEVWNNYEYAAPDWNRVYGSEISTPLLLSGIPTGTTALVAYVNYGTPTQQALTVSPAKSHTGAVIPGYYTVNTSGLGTGSVNIVVQARNGTTLLGGQTMTVAVAYAGDSVSSSTAIPIADVLLGSTSHTLAFGAKAMPSSNAGTFYFRVKGSAVWQQKAISGGTVDLPGLAAGYTYEYMVSSTDGDFYSTFSTDSSSAIHLPTIQVHDSLTGGTYAPAGFGMLGSALPTYDPVIQFGFAGSTLPKASSYVMALTINGVQHTVTLDANAIASYAGNSVLKLAATRYAKSSFGYSYVLKAEQSNGVVQIVGMGSGTLTVGDIVAPTIQPSTTSYYRPLGVLQLPSGQAPTGTLTLTCGSTVVNLNLSNDCRVTKTTDSSGHACLTLDLSTFWLATAAQKVTMSYSGSDAVFTGSYTVATSGAVTCNGITSQARQPMVPITVTGAVRLSALEVGASDSTLSSVASTLISTSGSTFTWNAQAQAGLGARRFYYEAVDANSHVIGKGYGTITVAADGSVSYTLDTPLLKPSIVQFTPPSTAATFELTVNGKQYTYQGNGAVSFDASSLRPASGSSNYAYTYIAIDAGGDKVSGGSGTLTVNANGSTSMTQTPDRQPVVLQGPQGDQVARLELDIRLHDSGASYTKIFLTGKWNAALNCSVFSWDPGSLMPTNGTTLQYDYVMSMQNADGSAYKNQIGNPISINGVMTLGGASPTGTQIQQYVTELQVSAQVSHNQNFNAFGEIAQEYDDATLQRAQAMGAFYGETVDASAVRTDFVYNALGKLITKTDPQTDITLANGYRYRDRPVTHYGYDLEGRLVTSTDANGHLISQTYDGGGEDHVNLQRQADGGRTLTDYDVFGSVRKITQSITATTDEVTLKTVDKMGNLLSSQQLGITRVQNATDGNAVASTLTDTYTYDAFGHRITHTDALGWVDKTYYDSLGRVIKTVTDAGRATTYTYTFVAAGAAGGIVGAGGKNVGGYQLTTTQADGHSTVDKTDYFGRTTWHEDEGGRTYVYNYDVGGHLSSQTSSGGQDIEYQYYANGDIKQAKDLADRTLTRYGYDNAGNRVWEEYSGLDASGDGPANAYQSSTIIYDELNRMSDVSDNNVDVRYEWDAVGNRRMVQATYWDPLGGLRHQDNFWYTYDATNRFTMTKGSLTHRGTSAGDTTGVIVQGSQGVAVGYDLRGDRISAKDANGTLETYTYTADGFLEDAYMNGVLGARRRVDSLGRTFEYIEWSGSTKTTDQSSLYDKDARLLQTTDMQGNITRNYYYGNGSAEDGSDAASATQAGNGDLARVDVTPTSGVGTSTVYSYQLWDSAKQTAIKVSATGSGTQDWAKGFSDLIYDDNGFLQGAYDYSDQRGYTYINSANGLLLQRADTGTGQGTLYNYWYYAADRMIGDISTDASQNDGTRTSYAEALAQSTPGGKENNNRYKSNAPVTSQASTTADFDQNYQPINATYPAATGTAYTVRSGDTLRGIAQAMWGDADMWYLIAQANNLSGNETLVAGQILQVPNKVTNIHNNAHTFRPYNPGEVIGHIDPSLPAPPPPPAQGGGCGTVGMVLMVVIAVVVTIYTAGAAAELMAGEASSLGSLTATMSAGAGVLGGSTAVGAATISAEAGMAAAAVGGAMGSIVSQVAGEKMGVVDHFSWKAVGQSALGAAVTAGVGQGLNHVAQGHSAFASAMKNADYGKYVRAGAQAVAATSISEAVEGHWSWREIAASAVGAEAGQGAGRAFEEATGSMGDEVSGFAKKLGAGLGSAWGQREVMATDPNYTRAGASAMFISSLGSAIGDTIADQPKPMSFDDFRHSEIQQENQDALPGQWIAQDDAIMRNQMQESGGLIADGAGFDADVAARRDGYQWQFGDETGLRSELAQNSFLSNLTKPAGAPSGPALSLDQFSGAYDIRPGDDMRGYSTYSYDYGDDGNLTRVTQTYHHGFLGEFDDKLGAASDWLQAQAAAVDEAGVQYAGQGNTLAAGFEASMYTPTRVAATVLGGLIQAPRLLTNADALPNLVYAASHPVATAQSAWADFNRMSLQDKAAAGLSVLLPSVGKLGALAEDASGIGRFLGADVGWNRGPTLATADGSLYGLIDGPAIPSGYRGAQMGAVSLPRFGLISEGEAVGNVGIDGAPAAGAAANGAEPTVTVFRVQGGTPPLASRQLITIDADGNPVISKTTLNISIGDPAHAEYFLSKRPGADITSFDIPQWMGDFIDEQSVPQVGYRTNPANQGGLAPKQVDPTTPGKSYELPDIWAQWLQEVAVPGSGKVTKGGTP